jgi:hypothetical protein
LADFTITYSGGVNEAPSVMTPDGIYAMDGRGDLNLADAQKSERFSLAHGQTATITKDHLKELDPDDDGAALTYTVTTLPRYGQLWLDTDGDGTINGAEVALSMSGTFTQADIDNGKLKYRNTDTVTTLGNNPPDDSFVFNLADGGENGAQAVTGATFNIEVTPKPPSPTLLSVLRASTTTAVTNGATTTYVTNADSLAFKVVFSETVRHVDASDFQLVAANGLSLTNVHVTGISAINGATDLVSVGGSGLANATGDLTLRLASSAADATATTSATAAATNIANATGSLVDITPPEASVNNEVYTLDNTGPAVSVALSTAATWHNGTAGAAFYVIVDFSETVNDLALSDFAVTNATLSRMKRWRQYATSAQAA